MMRSIRLSCVFLVCVQAQRANAEQGFDTPEEAYRAYLTGQVTEDPALMLSALTRDSQAFHVGLAVFSAEYLFGEDPEMQKVFQKHGVTKAFDDFNQQEEPGEEQLVLTIRKIKEPDKLLAYIYKRHSQLAEPLTKENEIKAERNHFTRVQRLQLVAQVTLKDVNIQGATATASVMIGESAQEHLRSLPQEMQFSRIEGEGWKCVIDPR